MTFERLTARATRFVVVSAPVAAVGLVLFLCYLDVSTTLASKSRTIGMLWNVTEEGLEIAEVYPGQPGEAAGFQVGDLLLEIAGVEVLDARNYDAAARRFGGSDAVVFTVRRDGTKVDVTVDPGVPVDWWPLLAANLSALLITAVGLMALFRSSGFVNGRLLFTFSILAALEFILPDSVVGAGWYDTYVAIPGFYLLTGLQIAVELHLVTLIPQRPRWAARHRWIIPAYYVVGLSLAFGVMLAAAVELEFVELPVALPWSWDAAFSLLMDWALPIWAAAILIMLATRAVTYPQPEGRLQAAIVLVGSLPWIIYIGISTVFGLFGELLPEWVDHAVPLLMVMFAASILLVMFREAQNRKNILVDLVEAMQEQTERSEVYSLIGYRLDLVFHPSSAHILGVDPEHGRQLILEHSSVGPLPEPPPELQALRDMARQIRRPFSLTKDRRTELPESEREWLDDAGTVLVVPLVAPAVRTVGMVLLGGKKAEEPYSHYDRQLLKSLAAHISVVLENLHLHDDVSRGRRAQREVVHRLLDEDVSVLAECPACHRCYDGGSETCPHDGEPLELTVPVERKVADRYLLRRRIDRGGMGAIFEAKDQRLDRLVAVKILLEFGQAEALKRFEREARICAGLSHPNIVAVHDYGRLRGDGAFLVMELLQGSSLRSRLRDTTKLTGKQVAEWFDQVLDALDLAHRQKVVHRDLKPSNLFLVENQGQSTVKILDFGLAKARDAAVDETKTFTSPGSFLGTLPYMAPEQIAGARVDSRADLFAVGVIAFEMLTGRWPFEGDTRSALVHAIAHQEPSFPAEWGEDSKLRRILDQCLSKMASDRFESAAELRRVLIPELAKAKIEPIHAGNLRAKSRKAMPDLPSRTERIEPAPDESQVTTGFGSGEGFASERLSDGADEEQGDFGSPAGKGRAAARGR